MDSSRPLIALLLALLSCHVVAADGGDLTPPKPIKQQTPVFPSNMRMAGLAGKVEVDFIIDEEGEVRNPVVVRSNNPWFERPAIEAILQWKFQPGLVNGKKVNTRASQRLEFNPQQAGSKDGLWFVRRPKHPDQRPPALQWHVAPQPVKTGFPVYPFAALQAGQTGSTTLRFIVGPDGRVAASRLIEASHPEMGHAVLSMIDTWEFTPPKKKDGTACFAALAMKHEFKPHASGDVPVPDEARKILRLLAKTPQAIASLKDLDHVPKPLSRRSPVYPTILRAAGQTGTAEIEFFIAPNGDAHLPSVVSSSATEFGYAAAQAVATWRFEPPIKAGKPTTVRVRIPIEFGAPTPPPAIPGEVTAFAQ